MNKSVILLSGGLDSVVALGAFKEEYGIVLALTFDYGQKSAKEEIYASKKVCEYYDIKHKIIKLNWLKEITKTALVSGSAVPKENLGTEESAKAVWVPNRNGLFLNIAASFCDSAGYNYIIFGANKDEGQTFSDNTEDFRRSISSVFELSTLVKPQVATPLINCTKSDIVKIAVEKSVPLEFVRSCYNIKEGVHCGKCESCLHLRRALEENNCYKYIDILFKRR
ncbi:7-cyano-7-deazaguanine synthase QueC [bacterium]|nr:7-cyano-7-deazaguanine synthase QueC [bacterium]